MAIEATGSITSTSPLPGYWNYSITLTDSGTTTIGTFWFAWNPGQDYLNTPPTSVFSPVGWTATVTHGSPRDGYGIEWVANSAANDIQAGGSLGGFGFVSADSPNVVASPSQYYSSHATTNSIVYILGAFGDPGYQIASIPFACFASGTRIETVDGPVAVEALRVGDHVVTASSGARAVVWIGHRRVNCRQHPEPSSVWPVRIRAHAFAPQRPARDLLVSPDHAVFVDGVLVPAGALVNGETIRAEPRDAVTYWHVELDAHDALLAENLPCESYLDTGNRDSFANAGPVVCAHPDFAPRPNAPAGFAPLVTSGPRLAAIRARYTPNSLRELPPAIAANVAASSPAEARWPIGSLSAMSYG